MKKITFLLVVLLCNAFLLKSQDYKLQIGGLTLSKSETTVLTAATHSPLITRGKVTYDPSTKRLTLDNAVINGYDEHGITFVGYAADEIYQYATVNVTVIGECEINSNKRGIFVDSYKNVIPKKNGAEFRIIGEVVNNYAERSKLTINAEDGVYLKGYEYYSLFYWHNATSRFEVKSDCIVEINATHSGIYSNGYGYVYLAKNSVLNFASAPSYGTLYNMLGINFRISGEPDGAPSNSQGAIMYPNDVEISGGDKETIVKNGVRYNGELLIASPNEFWIKEERPLVMYPGETRRVHYKMEPTYYMDFDWSIQNPSVAEIDYDADNKMIVRGKTIGNTKLIGTPVHGVSYAYGVSIDVGVVEDYPIKVAGIQVNSYNASNIMGDNSVYYDAWLNILTLKDANITYSHATEAAIEVDSYSFSKPQIELIGANTVRNEAGHGISTGSGADFRLEAKEGSLYVYAAKSGIVSNTDMIKFIGQGLVKVYAERYAVESYASAVLDFRNCNVELKGVNKVVDDIIDVEYNTTRLYSTSTNYAEFNAAKRTYVDTNKENVKEIRVLRKYPVWVGGTQVTVDNRHDILGNGTVSFNDKGNILTLNNANIIGNSSHNSGITAGIYSQFNLQVEVLGDNSITPKSSSASVLKEYGIYCEAGLDFLHTDGKLTINATARGITTTNNYGIYVSEDLKLGTNNENASDENLLKLEINSNWKGIGNKQPYYNVKGYKPFVMEVITPANLGIAYDRNFAYEDFKNDLPYRFYNGSTKESAELGTTNKKQEYLKVELVDVYDLWVNGRYVHAINKDDLATTGAASYNPETNTLTLENALLDKIATKGAYEIGAILGNGNEPLTVELIGDNKIDIKTEVDSHTYGILNGGEMDDNSSINFKGDGALTISYVEDDGYFIPERGCGLYAYNSTIDEATIIIANSNWGYSVEKDLTMLNGAGLYSYSKDKYSFNVGENINLYDGAIKRFGYEQATALKFDALQDYYFSPYNQYISISADYGPVVGGVAINPKNKDDVLADGGSVKYNPDTKVITLTDAHIENVNDGVRTFAAILGSQEDALKIELIGRNSIEISKTKETENQYARYYGIYNGDDYDLECHIEIFGSGSLHIDYIENKNLDPIKTWGIYAYETKISAADVYVNRFENGVCAERYITINNNAQLHINSTKLAIAAGEDINTVGDYTIRYGESRIWSQVLSTWSDYYNTHESMQQYLSISSDYGVFVGGVAISDKNKNDVLADGGSVKYNSTTKELTLTNATITRASVNKHYDQFLLAAILALDEDNISIKLIGENKIDISRNRPEEYVAAIWCSYEDNDSRTVSFIGSGSLIIRVGYNTAFVNGSAIQCGHININNAQLYIYSRGTGLSVGGLLKMANNAVLAVDATPYCITFGNYAEGHEIYSGAKYMTRSFIDRQYSYIEKQSFEELYDIDRAGIISSGYFYIGRDDRTAPTINNNMLTTNIDHSINRVDLSWNPAVDNITPQEFIFYEVMSRSVDNNTIVWRRAQYDPFNIFIYDDAHGEQEITVYAYDAAGNKSTYEAFRFMPEEYTSIKNQKEDAYSYWTGNGTLHVKLPNYANMKIFSISGQLMDSRVNAIGDIEIPLQRGIYILIVNNEANKLIIR